MKTQRQPRPTVKAILDEPVTLSVECLARFRSPSSLHTGLLA
ncbi:MAG TPA: hypothetical protein P5186_07670 [Candidatus Paceibacterota bacterium]|nr:hypothetical protein [Candidatus Paceibacterota bacterium]